MSRRHYNLPPLTTLTAFEAAARHLSFKQAAKELSVTPGAVSHQVKALEGELGVALFRRKHRGVELTPPGRTLYDTLAASLTKVSQSLQAIRDQGSAGVVTVGSTTAMASMWLSPAVIRFWRDHPEININQVVRDRAFTTSAEMDLYIWYGREKDQRLDQFPLYRDRLLPVAAPEKAAELAGADLDLLARQRLIHLEGDDISWTKWHDWFRQLGYSGPVASGIRVNNYSIALQAARDGAGLTLGWERLISPLTDRGDLHVIPPHVLSAPERFFLVSKPEEELTPSARMLRDWIISEASQLTDEPS
ncbi:LysR substrate-binding domain-containing protein [Tritonibacter mobilis]|uniref:LysR substrate-binding domain-containing protein n=1 Tax=Tritonibacter mobilis TaxID=379347 RepID=UPI0008069878|nr:LysR substrate-binding domain-containing protein [Tritonibacter mobilis]NHM17927.1 LysR family transcriptional regulator [Tritonibacter mobilis]NHM24007.1 LysR family transcriptional regulator [Tritonibacter mobilis]GLP85629.1 LysR family transcriptional regulator [Tritonibacter mobilis]SDW64694.1 transcriptional regulator, LysR family [Tritonibacter mobilis]